MEDQRLELRSPEFRAFSNMFNHLGQGRRTRGKGPGACTVTEQSKVAAATHSLQATRAISFNSICIKNQYSVISKQMKLLGKTIQIWLECLQCLF